jgi:hypothetical protein
MAIAFNLSRGETNAFPQTATEAIVEMMILIIALSGYIMVTIGTSFTKSNKA